ncbi:MAG: VOC family protein [Polyangiaceae bacterium]
MASHLSLIPLLIVRDAARALDFYRTALSAEELARYLNRVKGTISHADLRVGEAAFSITEEAREWNSDAPPSLGGSPVVLQLRVSDVDATVGAMCSAGASIVFPVQEFCGERMARVRDPFGHLWILSQLLEELSPKEKQERRDALFAQFASRASTPQTPNNEQ